MSTDFVICSQGAEATLSRGLYLGRRTMLKRRLPKGYRHPHLDKTLTQERTKAEAKALIRARAAGVCVPAIYLVDLQRSSIYMEDICDGITLKDYIDRTSLETQSECKLKNLMKEIGMCISKLHDDGIIHGDLTSSNVMIIPSSKKTVEKLYFVDFGLSHTASTVEDKAVDLYVLERALQSTHANSERLFQGLMIGYITNSGKFGNQVIEKLNQVRARGRKRTMVG